MLTSQKKIHSMKYHAYFILKKNSHSNNVKHGKITCQKELLKVANRTCVQNTNSVEEQSTEELEKPKNKLADQSSRVSNKSSVLNGTETISDMLLFVTMQC